MSIMAFGEGPVVVPGPPQVQFVRPPKADKTTIIVPVGGPAGPPGPRGNPGPINTTPVDAHINSETPHPVYDDGPSLLLLYQNAKV